MKVGHIKEDCTILFFPLAKLTMSNDPGIPEESQIPQPQPRAPTGTILIQIDVLPNGDIRTVRMT